MNEQISSVTVTYNPEIDVLEKQILSIINQVSTIIIVDNGSQNLPEILTQKLKIESEYKCNIEILTNDKNVGLAKAQNIGIEKALQNETDYIILLDQDSILEHNCISNMKNVYINSNVDLLGPVFYDPDSGVEYPGTNYNGPFINRDKIESCSEVTYIIASGSFFSADIYKKNGPMVEELFIDYIDVEWSLRAKSKGMKIAMTNRAKMSHTIGDCRREFFGRTISVHSPMRRYYLTRNSFYMLRLKYVPVGYKLREITFNIFRTIIGVFYSEDKSYTIKLAFRGVKDGLKGNYGSYN